MKHKESQKGSFLLWLSERLDLPTEVLGNAPQIRISGTRQVLVERHCGIAGLDPARIVVRAVHGCVRIEGDGLCIAAMSHQRVVIRGTVHCVVVEEG